MCFTQLNIFARKETETGITETLKNDDKSCKLAQRNMFFVNAFLRKIDNFSHCESRVHEIVSTTCIVFLKKSNVIVQKRDAFP